MRPELRKRRVRRYVGVEGQQTQSFNDIVVIFTFVIVIHDRGKDLPELANLLFKLVDNLLAALLGNVIQVPRNIPRFKKLPDFSSFFNQTGTYGISIPLKAALNRFEHVHCGGSGSWNLFLLTF